MMLREAGVPEAALTAEQMKATGVHATMVAQKLRTDITVLFGSGANMTVFKDSDGLIMVDSGFSASRPEIEATLAAISPRGVRYLINSHFHFDHTDGNAWLHEAGAELVAESHTRLRMTQAQRIPAFRTIQTPAPFSALPSITFNHLMRIELRSESILLKRYTPAHTDSDIAIYFENRDVLHVADTWFNGVYPFVDVDGGGSIDGLLVAAKENLSLAGPKTLVVPGHGKVGTREDLVEFYDMLVEVRGQVSTLKSAGRSFEEVLRFRPAEPFDNKFGHGFIPNTLFLYQLYRSI